MLTGTVISEVGEDVGGIGKVGGDVGRVVEAGGDGGGQLGKGVHLLLGISTPSPSLLKIPPMAPATAPITNAITPRMYDLYLFHHGWPALST